MSRTTIWRRRAIALVAAVAVIVGGLMLLGGGTDGLRSALGGGDVREEVVTIHSRALDRPIHARVLLPAGGDDALRGRPLLVDLHGKGKSAPTQSDFAAKASAIDALGTRAPVIVLAADDGDSYWHDRSTGAWGTYLVSDLIPQIRRRYALSSRTALSGLSMGGSGVLAASLAHPGRFCAVVASSPALFTSGATSAAGAYDDAEDYAARNPFALLASSPRALASTPTWIDIGDRDPFLEATRTFVARAKPTKPQLRFSIEPGGHDGQFWGARYPLYLRWLAARLADCQR